MIYLAAAVLLLVPALLIGGFNGVSLLGVVLVTAGIVHIIRKKEA